MAQQVKVLAAKPEFKFWAPLGERRELTAASCLPHVCQDNTCASPNTLTHDK